MFKVSEVAGKLNVDTYVIFEKLLNHKDLLKHHTEKVHSINYIDDIGVEMMNLLIQGKSEEEIERQMHAENNDEPSLPENGSEQVQMESNAVHAAIDQTFETVDQDEEWLNAEDFIQLDHEKKRLRSEIGKLRGLLVQYDSELKRLDDAMINYQVEMQTDVGHLQALEAALEEKIKLHASQREAGESSGVFSFMKK